jgi:hypothetical protein
MEQQETAPKVCNCRVKENCPLNGQCRVNSVVYQATITHTEQVASGGTTEKTETYIGLTDSEFKIRLANHTQSFRNEKLKNSTELSKHVWRLKNENKVYNLNWKIIGHASSYSNKTKNCNLCNLEKYYLIFQKEKATLNQKCGFVSSCRHAAKYLLSHHPT